MASRADGVPHETVEYMERCVAEQNAVGRALVQARARTEHYKDEEPPVLLERSTEELNETLVEVRNERALCAVRRLASEGYESSFLLNFANAYRSGGGFLRGALAQEERIARGSGLYYCLKDQPLYKRNADVDGNRELYLHDMLYSPDVPVLRDPVSETLLSEEEVFLVTILTSPAPNARDAPSDVTPEEFSAKFRERIQRILTVAANKGHTALVLGAFGCGAFRNDPVMVATHFEELLSSAFRGYFQKIVFAVHEAPNGPNITTFQRTITQTKP